MAEMREKIARQQVIQETNVIEPTIPAQTRRRGPTDVEMQEIEEGRARSRGGGGGGTAPAAPTTTTTQQASTSEEDRMGPFLALVERINERLDKIRFNIGKVSQLHTDVINSTIAERTQELNTELHGLMDETRADLKFVKEALEKISNENRELRNQGILQRRTADLRIRESQHRFLTGKYTEVLESWGQVQDKMKDRYKERVSRQLRIVQPSITDDELESILESSTTTVDEIFKQKIVNSTHANAKAAYLEVVEQHKDILAIETSLRELFQMFVDLALLVDQQGEVLDKIEDNVREASEYVERTTEQMQRAHVYQKRSRKLIFIIIVVVVVVLLIAAVLIAVGVTVPVVIATRN